jgi:hypothetical protein
MQGDMAALHYCLHGDREILAAHFLGATEYTRALGLVGMTYDTAMRTNRAVGPQKTFEEFAGRFVIAEMGSRENVHVVTSMTKTLHHSSCGVNDIIAKELMTGQSHPHWLELLGFTRFQLP